MSNTKGSLLISNANAVGTALITKLGGTGYKPSEWGDAVNLLGISSSDISTALANITTGSYTGSERGSIKISNLNLVGSMLNKKFNTDRGFKPNEWESAISKLTALEIKTASGAIASFSDGADEVPVKNWLVTLPASLSGYSEVNGVRSGKNLLAKDIVRYSNSLATLSECFAIHHGTYTVTIGTVANANNWRLSVLLMDGEGNALTDNAYKPSNELQLATNRWRYGSNTTTKVYTVTIVTDCYIRFFIELGDTSSSTTVTDSYLEVGSTATAYSAYEAPTQYTASLGRTIYGGECDIVTGEGEDEYIKYVIDGVNNYAVNISGTNFNIMPYGLNIDGTISKWLCDTITANSTNFGYNSSQGFIFIRQAGWSSISGVTDVATFNAYCQNNPITLILPKITADTFTFTPITAETELGTNNFWAEEGDSAVTYRADIDLALNA